MKYTASTRYMLDALGVSYNTLSRLRAQGVLRPGEHYVSVAASTKGRATYRWDPNAVEATLARRSKSLPLPADR